MSGKVEHVYGPRAFTIDRGMQDGDLLVLGAEPFSELPGMRGGQDALEGDQKPGSRWQRRASCSV